MMPVECDHGVVADWGDFGPDPDDGQVGVYPCLVCVAEEYIEDMQRQRGGQPDAR